MNMESSLDEETRHSNLFTIYGQRKSLSTDEEKTRAMIEAEEIVSMLGFEFPTFTKSIVRGINDYWMGIPGYFSREHLPRTDSTIILVDENRKEFELKYIGETMGLCAGWRIFRIEQKLLEDDVLIFQLVEPCKFKVYVVRANDVNQIDCALNLIDSEAEVERNDAEGNGGLQLKNKKPRSGKSIQTKKFENGYDATSFGNIKDFKNFNITVDGLCIDSELPDDIREKYYDLCCMRNDLLHTHLIEGLNSKLIAGMICEVVTIASAIQIGTLTATSRYELTLWDKTLRSFDLLGMKVGFLCDRVHKLKDIAFKLAWASQKINYLEVKKKKVQAEITELMETIEKKHEIEISKNRAEAFKLKFQEEVDAPW